MAPSSQGHDPFEGTLVRKDTETPRVAHHKQRLVVLEGPDRGRQFEVDAPRVVIGSTVGADVVLNDPSVSRRHAVIEVVRAAYRLTDLGSTNGTRVDGHAITAPVDLAPGARIQVGDTELLFEPRMRLVRVAPVDVALWQGLAGGSAPMREAKDLLAHVAPTDLSCLVLGETGTGKEVAARGLHAASPRAAGPFVVIDCAAISPTLIESELFGHERGSFTGADRARTGAIESASGGTLFLDEIGELPLELQPKLLRALERREIKRLGASGYVDVDVRIVAATHRDLPAMVERGAFRADLLYRLAEVVVRLPTLASRPEDVGAIARRLIETESRDGPRELSEDAVLVLAEQPWPGNARELRNVVRRALATTPRGSIIDGRAMRRVLSSSLTLPSAAPAAAVSTAGDRLSLAHEGPESETLEEARARWSEPLDRAWLERLMSRADGDLTKAAALAGLHPKSLDRLLRRRSLKGPRA